MFLIPLPAPRPPPPSPQLNNKVNYDPVILFPAAGKIRT